MSMKRRIICLSMAGVLALSGPAPLFGQGITSEELFSDVLVKYSYMLTEDSARAFYNMYSGMQQMDVKSLLQTEVEKLSAEELERLEFYGFGSNSKAITEEIYDVYEAFLDQFPSDISALQDGGNVFSELYFKGEDLTSDDFNALAPDLQDVSKKIYRAFPSDFRKEIRSWVSGTVYSELDVFKVFYDTIIDEGMGTEKYYDYSNVNQVSYTVVNLFVSNSAKTTMKSDLRDIVGDKVSDYSLDSVIDAYTAMMNTILNAVESHLELEKVLDTAKAGNTNYDTLSILRDMDVLDELDTYVEPKQSSGGGSHSGGGGSGGGNKSNNTTTTPSTPTNNTDTTVNVDDEETPQGPVNVEKEYASENLEAAKDLAKGLESQTADQASKSVADMAKTLGDEMTSKNLNGFEAVQVANQVADLAEEVLKKADVTPEQAKAVVKETIESAFKGAAARDTVGANAAQMNAKAVKLVEEVIKKAATVKSESAQVAVSKDSVDTALKAASEAAAEMKETLAANGLAKAAAVIKPLISIKLAATVEEQVVEFDADTVEALRGADAEVELDLGGLKFRMPTDVLADFVEKGVAVESDILSAEESAGVKAAEATDGTDIDVVSDVYDIDVKAGGQKAEFKGGKLKLTIDVSKEVSMLATQAHKLSVFVFEEATGAWEHVPTKIVDGVAEFEAPHFSKYAVLKANVKFDDITGHWAQETIEKMTANKITAGRSETAFEPDAEITRAEFAAYLVNMVGLEGQVGGNFKDVPEGAWYYDAVALAGVNGLVSGVGEGNFAPEATITRQDMAVMMSKAYKLMTGTAMTGEAEPFGDSILIADYAYDAVTAAKYHKIVGGFEDGSFQPSKTATRAEAAQMLRILWEEN